MSETHPLLIELGCEELPAAQLAQQAQAFADGITQALLDHEVLEPHSSAEVLYTPRRLGLLFASVQSQQPEKTIERKGPAVAAAFDDHGQPTPAAEGFAKSVGLAVDDLDRLVSDQGEWLAATVTQPGQTVNMIVADALAKVTQQMAGTKTMRWRDDNARFLRPVRWLVVLHGPSVLPIELFGLEADRITWGHRVHHPEPISLTQAQDYVSALEQAHVLVRPDDRKARIESEVQACITEHEWSPDAASFDALVEENTQLTEWPVAVLGRFDPSFLEVPEPALISAMQYHQKSFALRDNKSMQLVSYFISIANIESQNPKAMVAGFERVIRPRLADAEFFWNQDKSEPLSNRFSGLADMLFQKELGSIGDKTQRLERLAPQWAEALGADAKKVERAAHLSKCDLITQMVGEFPELQGVMGRYYALNDDEPEAVATAIEQHYWPRFSGDHLPTSPEGLAVGLADRVDTLVGIFGTGGKPKGSKDPFALRRAALGLVRILEAHPNLEIRAVLSEGAEVLAESLGWDEPSQQACVDQVYTFCMDRLRAYALDQGLSTATWNTVSAIPTSGVADLLARAQSVEAFRTHPHIETLVAVNKRLANVLDQAKGIESSAVDTTLFVEPQEHDLHSEWAVKQKTFDAAMGEGDYAQALDLLSGLAEPLDAFFENVMVMAEDEKLKANRLTLLQPMRTAFLQIGDFTQLGV